MAILLLIRIIIWINVLIIFVWEILIRLIIVKEMIIMKIKQKIDAKIIINYNQVL